MTIDHKSTAYKVISSAGQILIKAIERVLDLCAVEKGAVFDPSQMTWVKGVEQHTDVILAELDNLNLN